MESVVHITRNVDPSTGAFGKGLCSGEGPSGGRQTSEAKVVDIVVDVGRSLPWPETLPVMSLTARWLRKDMAWAKRCKKKCTV